MIIFTCSAISTDKQIVTAVLDDGRAVILKRPMGIIEECIEEIHSDSWQVLAHGNRVVPVVNPSGSVMWADVSNVENPQLATIGQMRNDPLMHQYVDLYMAILRHEFE